MCCRILQCVSVCFCVSFCMCARVCRCLSLWKCLPLSPSRSQSDFAPFVARQRLKPPAEIIIEPTFHIRKSWGKKEFSPCLRPFPHSSQFFMQFFVVCDEKVYLDSIMGFCDVPHFSDPLKSSRYSIWHASMAIQKSSVITNRLWREMCIHI